MKLFVAALLACALPAFGQDARGQLAARLHETCVAHAQEAVQREWMSAAQTPVDSARFCGCADEQIQKERMLARVAKLPEPDRQSSSRPMAALQKVYFMGGFRCYSNRADFPRRAAAVEKDGRPLEEVRVGLERRKGALYAAYNRALKRDPWLVGKVVVEFAIEPSGEVTDLRVQSDDLSDTVLLDELKSQVASLKFPAEPVPKLVTKYPIEFLPD